VAVAVKSKRLSDEARAARDRRRRQEALKSLSGVQARLDAAMARRTELWNELAHRPDQRVATQVEKLSRLIDALYAESRARRACVSHGSRELILEKARHEMLVERDRRHLV
jgi:hypothetical protein